MACFLLMARLNCKRRCAALCLGDCTCSICAIEIVEVNRAAESDKCIYIKAGRHRDNCVDVVICPTMTARYPYDFNGTVRALWCSRTEAAQSPYGHASTLQFLSPNWHKQFER